MKKAINLISLFTIIFFSCGHGPCFIEPQPKEVKPLTSIPERLRGNYISADYTSSLTITDNCISKFIFAVKMHRDSMGNTFVLRHDTLMDLKDSTIEKVKLKGDTVIVSFDWTDTLFYLSQSDVLKKFKGYYFLNRKITDSCWEVNCVSLKKGVLKYKSLLNEEDIQKLNAITESDTDSVTTVYSPSKKQFRKLIKDGGFRKQEEFYKIRN